MKIIEEDRNMRVKTQSRIKMEFKASTTQLLHCGHLLRSKDRLDSLRSIQSFRYVRIIFLEEIEFDQKLHIEPSKTFVDLQ